MNLNGSTESSEGILNSTNVPFTTLLNIPLGICDPPLDSSSSMITPPPAPDRNENHSFDSLATPTSVSAAALHNASRAQQHLNYANAARLLQSPSDYFGLLNSLIRQHQESPPTPSLQPNSDSVLSLWPSSAVEGYFDFINSLIRQHHQEPPPTLSHSPSIGSVRSLWPPGAVEDDGSLPRSAPHNLSYSYGSREYYARSPNRVNNHLSVEACSPIGGNVPTSSTTSCSPKSPRRGNGQSYSPKSPSRANAFANQVSSCSPKSPNGSNIHVTSCPKSPSRNYSTRKSCSPKSPSTFHTPLSPCLPKSPSRANSTRELCSPKSLSRDNSTRELCSPKSPSRANPTRELCSPKSLSRDNSTRELCSPKSPSRANSTKELCSPKSPSRGNSIKGLCSPKSPSRANSISELCPSMSPIRANSTRELCSPKSPIRANSTRELCFPKSSNRANSTKEPCSPKSLKGLNAPTPSLPPSSRPSLNGAIFDKESPPKTMFSTETLTSPLSLTIGASSTDSSLSTGITSSPLIIPVVHRLNREQTLPHSNKGDRSSPFDSSPRAENNTRLEAEISEDKNISHMRSSEGWPSHAAKSMSRYSELTCPLLTREPNVGLYEEEKIDVWSVKDSLLLKVVEPHQISKDTVDSESESRDTEPGSPQIHSQLGAECSRTVPSLMKFYSRHKLSLNSSSSLSINLAVAGQATPPCSPISPGTHNSAILPSNTMGFPISPALIIQPGITSLSSPIGTYNAIPHNSSTPQTSIQGPLNVSIPSYASTQTSSSPRKSSGLSQCAQIFPSNAKILSLEASTMTSPMEKSSEHSVLPSSSSPSRTNFETISSTATRNSITTSTTQVNEINRTRQSTIEALTVLTVPTVVPTTLYSPASQHVKLMTSPPIKPGKKLKSAESDQSAFSHVNLNSPLNHSASMPVPTTTSASTLGPIPTGMNFASPWSISSNPLSHPGSYWLPPSQYSSVDPGVGAASLSLGYHIARDQLTGHLYLLPRPHPLSDPSSHGLMWTGYGSMGPPPVVMSPQQLLLSDPHFRHALHPPLMHVHHPSAVHSSSPSKNRESPSLALKEAKKALSPIVGSRSPSAAELSLPPPMAAPHYLYPPTTLPYYYSQPPHHSYAIPGYPPHGSTQSLGMPANLMQAITTIPFTTSTPTLTTAAATLTPLTVTTTHSNVKISSSASSSVWSRGSDIPISSPGLHHESLIGRLSDPYSDPPMDLTQRRSKSPPYTKESDATTCSSQSKPSLCSSQVKPFKNSKIGVATPKLSKPIVIKKEIKQEVLSPPLVNSEEEAAHEPKMKPNIKMELNKTFSHLVGSRENTGSYQEATVPVPCSEHKPNSSNVPVHELMPLNEMEKSSEKVFNTKSPLHKNDIDSSGLELLFQTFLQHGDRLAPSPSEDMDSNSSHSEQMPHLERAAKTPSPRCSPYSYESLPPVLTPFATTPNVPRESASGAPSPVASPPPMDIYPLNELMPPQPEPLSSPQQSKANCFSVLCALAEQRILEEQQNNCSALSSLAEVALATPSVPTELPLYSSDCLVPTPESYLDQSYIDGDCSGNEQSEPSTSFSESVTSQFQANESSRATDINRNYKSPESEREVKAFIANKVSQYHKDYISEANSLLPNYQIDDMDPSEIDMRMKLADIQRQYKEKQIELSKLLPKKDMFTPSKRGRGRPPKPKITLPIPGIKRKVGRPQKKLLEGEESVMSPNENEDFETLNEESGDMASESVLESKSPMQLTHLDSPEFPYRSLSQSPPQSPPQSPLERNEVQSFLTNCEVESKIDEASDDEIYSHTKDLNSTFKPPTSHIQDMKHDDSDDDARSEISSSKIENVQPHPETSVESSTSDAEIHVSSSKKRKPGRPKKHSPTKYDATETIVAKKSKSLGFMLLQKSKIRPKLKAELKIRDSDEEDEEDNDFHHQASNYEDISEEEEQEDSNSKQLPKLATVTHSKGSISNSKKATLCTQHHGAPRGRSSLSRNTILRDKEKRKTAFEKNSQMQQLFRSLKRHSKVADPEHDESGDEREDNYSDEDEIERKETQELTNNQDPPFKDGTNLSNSAPPEASQPPTNQESGEPTIVVKKEDNIIYDSVPIEDLAKTIMPIQDSLIKEEVDNALDDKDGEANVISPEKEKEISVCSLQVEDLVKGARVLVLQDGLLYAGSLVPLNPPDVYDVRIDGERGTKQHICCLEDLVLRSWKEVKPGSTRFLTEGTRVCAFWSQQYRGLYPGCVAAASSPTHEGNHNLVNVEFDDGDSGRIHVDDIRLLPSDFPVVDYDPNPLVTLNKRKRRPTEEDSTEGKSPENTKCQENSSSVQNCKSLKKKIKKDNKTRNDKENATTLKTEVQGDKLSQLNRKTTKEDDAEIVSDDIEDKTDKKIEVQKWTTDQFLLNTGAKTAKRRRALSLPSSGKKHKKRHHSDKHRHRHKRRRRTLEDYRIHPHIEQGDNELRMRIKSPPPIQEESLPTQFNYREPSSSEEEELAMEKQSKTKKPQRRIKRSPSEKSKIAPFLPAQQLWKWSGKGYKRPGGKGKGKKEFYKEIVRGKERIRVGDCAVFLSSGSPERPFIGKIDFLWEGWGGNMVVKVRWFYHPDETKEAERNLADPRDALFSSSHTDENDVQTISHRCDVFSLADYRLKKAEIDSQKGSDSENNDLYYLAGYYDTTYGRITMEPGVS